MTYAFKQNLVSKDKYSIKCPNSMTAEFIVAHNTANDAPAANEISYMISNNNEVSFHFAVDDKEVIQGLPIDRNAWACGDGGSGQGNRKGIQVEICYSKSGGSKFDAAEKNAAEFIASLLKERGWGIDKVKKHQDFANKYCPHRTLDNGWDRFLNMIKSHLNSTPNTSTSTSTPATSNSNSTSIKVGDKVKVKTTATHYATGQSIASFVKGSTYEVTKVDGSKLLLADIVSWVWDYDVEKQGSTTSSSTEFMVRIICDELNIREQASFDSKVVGTVKLGEAFTITEEKNGLYKLKSGAGWISAGTAYVQKI